jgi:hypothetical protein
MCFVNKNKVSFADCPGVAEHTLDRRKQNRMIEIAPAERGA